MIDFFDIIIFRCKGRRRYSSRSNYSDTGISGISIGDESLVDVELFVIDSNPLISIVAIMFTLAMQRMVLKIRSPGYAPRRPVSTKE